MMEQANNLYRVKIGPYPDRQSALNAVQLVSDRIGILPVSPPNRRGGPARVAPAILDPQNRQATRRLALPGFGLPVAARARPGTAAHVQVPSCASSACLRGSPPQNRSTRCRCRSRGDGE